MSQFLHDNDNNNADAKAIAIPWVFSENSRANKICLRTQIPLNAKALVNVKFFCGQTNGQMDKGTGKKTTSPHDLSMWGHRNESKMCICLLLIGLADIKSSAQIPSSSCSCTCTKKEAPEGP